MARAKDDIGAIVVPVSPAPRVTEETKQTARIKLASQALDSGEPDKVTALRDVLEMLGLMPDQPSPRSTVKWKVKQLHPAPKADGPERNP